MRGMMNVLPVFLVALGVVWRGLGGSRVRHVGG